MIEDPPLKQPQKRSRLRRLGRSMAAALSPAPEERIEPVPPGQRQTEAALRSSSPFMVGFLGALGVLVAVALAEAVATVHSVLILVVLALFLALGISPAVEALTRRRVPRSIAVALIIFAALLIATLGVVALVPILTEQATLLVQNLPRILDNIASHPRLAEWDERYAIIERVESFVSSGGLLDTAFGGLLGAGQMVANAVFSIIMTVVLTAYFLASLPHIKHGIYSLAPASRRPRVRYLADEIFRGISGYLTGMFIVVCVAAGCAFIFMNIAGLGTYSLALSFLVAIFCFIPMIGTFLAMGAVALVAFGTNPTLGIATVIYFLIYSQIDAYLINPTVMKRTVKVPSALVVLSALIGGMLLGLIGVLIAIPTTAALLLLYREIVRPALDAA